MNKKIVELDWLQQNIATIKKFSHEEKRAAVKAFHKAGHIIMYVYHEMRFKFASLDIPDSIEEDLDYESLRDTNHPERYGIIAMGGVMMEQLITQSNDVSKDSEDDVEKTILLIQAANSNQSNNVRDSEYYISISILVCEILIKNQRQIGQIYFELVKNRTLTYSRIQSILNGK